MKQNIQERGYRQRCCLYLAWASRYLSNIVTDGPEDRVIERDKEGRQGERGRGREESQRGTNECVERIMPSHQDARSDDRK